MTPPIVHKLDKFLPVGRLISLSKKVVLPGFEGVPLYDVLAFFARALVNGAITTRASALSFNFFLTLFPSVIFLFSLIPYIPIENFDKQLLRQIEFLLPKEAFSLSQATIEDIVSQPRGGILSFSFLASIFFATNGIDGIIDAFNQSYFIKEKRSLLMQRVISVVLMFIIATLVISSILLIVFNQILFDFLRHESILEAHTNPLFLKASNWAILLLLFYFSVSFIYYLGPSRKTKWRFFSAGSSLATLLMVIVSSGFAYYVNHFASYNKLYGSIGTLIVILLWIYFNSLALLTGFDLNTSIKASNRR